MKDITMVAFLPRPGYAFPHVQVGRNYSHQTPENIADVVTKLRERAAASYDTIQSGDPHTYVETTNIYEFWNRLGRLHYDDDTNQVWFETKELFNDLLEQFVSEDDREFVVEVLNSIVSDYVPSAALRVYLYERRIYPFGSRTGEGRENAYLALYENILVRMGAPSCTQLAMHLLNVSSVDNINHLKLIIPNDRLS